jgi:hypothetical protein
MEYQFAKQKSKEINAEVSKNLRELKKKIGFEFITNTLYHY